MFSCSKIEQKQLNTWVSFQSAEQPLLGQFSVSGNRLNGESRKIAIDTVISLLWETGRDQTLAQFAKEYLSGDEYKVTMCRLSERQAHYPDAYACWNNLGHEDRAERTIRTEAALRILGTE